MQRAGLGLDLGTTISLASIVDATGRPTVITGPEGSHLIPSAIYFDKHIVVGESALDAGLRDPQGLAEAFKRDIGKPHYSREIRSTLVPPEVLTAFLIRHLLGNVRATLFSDLKMDRKAMAEFVGRHTNYNDVVFSVDEIVQRHFVVYSMKKVHRVKNIVEIYDMVKNIPGPYIINLFSKGPEEWGPPYNLWELANMAYEQVHEGDVHLRKIRKEDFLKYYQHLVNTSNPPITAQESSP